MTRILVMDTRSLADAKTHLSEIVDSVEETQEHVAITRRGRPAAVLMSVDEYEGLMETLDLMATPGASQARGSRGLAGLTARSRSRSPARFGR